MKRALTTLLVAAAASCGFLGCSTEATSEEAEATDEALSSMIRQRVTCQSWDYDYDACDVNTHGGRIVNVRVSRQLSSSSCDEGRSFGSGSDYVWVDRGCRAEFEVTIRVSGGGGGEIVLYEHDRFRGQSLTLNADHNNFDHIGFNDTVSSLIVRQGVWQLCEHSDYRGVCREYGPGSYRAVGSDLNDLFSSARLLDW
jgi:hypothetical protein